MNTFSKIENLQRLRNSRKLNNPPQRIVIVKPGSKARYLADLSWLTDIALAVYHFANTIDGYKLLYEDGVFCEFAVFEEVELPQIPFAPGRIVWKAPGVDEAIRLPKKIEIGGQRPLTEWLIG